MEIEFWEHSQGKSPIIQEIGNNPVLRARILKKLERFQDREFIQLQLAGEIEKIKQKNRNKIHELRVDVGRIACRFLFTYKNKKAYLLRFINKKRGDIKSNDIQVADNRADQIP